MASEAKVDPIRENYYAPLERAEKGNDYLFYLTTFLGVCALTLAKFHFVNTVCIISLFFILVVVSSFILSLAIRLYFMPRAEDCRRNDLASNAFGASLQPEQTEHYYNNGEDPSFRRLAGILAENAFFSAALTKKMCSGERVKIVVSLIIFLLLVLNRETGIDWVIIAAQFVASEQVASKWVRMEWLRSQFERTYRETFTLLTIGQKDTPTFKAKTVAIAMNYEANKANAAVLLSSRIFIAINETLTQEWENIHKPKLDLP